MAILINVKANQILPKVSNWRAQRGFLPDDSYTKGLEYGKLVGVITGKMDGEDAPVYTYAGTVGATYTDIGDRPIAVPAVVARGILFETSERNQYLAPDNQSDETRLFPMGARQDKMLAPVPEWVWEIQDTDMTFGHAGYFRLTDKLMPTADSFDDTTATIVFDGEITDVREEETVEIDGAEYKILSIVYDDSTDKTTFTLDTGAGDVVDDVLLKSQLFAPVFLPDDMTGLPFTMIEDDGSGGRRQSIGYVESALAIRGKLI